MIFVIMRNRSKNEAAASFLLRFRMIAKSSKAASYETQVHLSQHPRAPSGIPFQHPPGQPPPTVP